jgi:hypothetical protein
MLLKEIGDKLALRQGEGAIRMISVNFHAQQLSGWAQISELEVRR